MDNYKFFSCKIISLYTISILALRNGLKIEGENSRLFRIISQQKSRKNILSTIDSQTFTHVCCSYICFQFFLERVLIFGNSNDLIHLFINVYATVNHTFVIIFFISLQLSALKYILSVLKYIKNNLNYTEMHEFLKSDIIKTTETIHSK